MGLGSGAAAKAARLPPASSAPAARAMSAVHGQTPVAATALQRSSANAFLAASVTLGDGGLPGRQVATAGDLGPAAAQDRRCGSMSVKSILLAELVCSG